MDTNWLLIVAMLAASIGIPLVVFLLYCKSTKEAQAQARKRELARKHSTELGEIARNVGSALSRIPARAGVNTELVMEMDWAPYSLHRSSWFSFSTFQEGLRNPWGGAVRVTTTDDGAGIVIESDSVPAGAVRRILLGRDVPFSRAIINGTVWDGESVMGVVELAESGGNNVRLEVPPQSTAAA